MKPRFLPLAIFAFALFSALADGETHWKKIENEYFSFIVPGSFKKTEARGIDSFVEEYVSNGIKLEFDYGWYSNNFDDWPKDTKYEIIKVDGKTARVGTMKETYEKDYPLLTQIHIQGTGLTMFAFCKPETKVTIAREIFESITFRKDLNPVDVIRSSGGRMPQFCGHRWIFCGNWGKLR